MYSKIAEEEDNELAERWQKDADGLLIFVSPRSAYIVLCVTLNTIDWFILRCRRCVAFRVSPEPDSQQSGHLLILSRKHLWDPRRP